MDFKQADEYLDEMKKLLDNKLEKKEHTIDYFIERHQNTAKKSNELLQIEGEIDYYQKILSKLISKKIDLVYLLEDGELKLGDDDQHNHRPNGEGGSGYLATQARDKESGKYDIKANSIVRKSDAIQMSCQEEIRKLEDKINKIENSSSNNP